MRHIEVRWFWLQEEVRAGRVVVTKVRGEWNPADLMTKYLNIKEIRDRLEWMGIDVEEEKEAVIEQVRKEQRRSWQRRRGKNDEVQSC